MRRRRVLVLIHEDFLVPLDTATLPPSKLERIKTDTHRDYWMTAEESVEYGLIDSILESASALD